VSPCAAVGGSRTARSPGCVVRVCRFEKRIYIPLPTVDDREKLLAICLREIALADDVDLRSLAERMDGYSGADVANVCRDVAMVPMRKVMAQVRAKGIGLRNVEEMRKMLAEGASAGALEASVGQADFVDTITKVSSSVGGADLKRYQQWVDEFGAS